MSPGQPWMWHWGGMWIFPMIMFVVMIIFLLSQYASKNYAL